MAKGPQAAQFYGSPALRQMVAEREHQVRGDPALIQGRNEFVHDEALQNVMHKLSISEHFTPKELEHLHRALKARFPRYRQVTTTDYRESQRLEGHPRSSPEDLEGTGMRAYLRRNTSAADRRGFTRSSSSLKSARARVRSLESPRRVKTHRWVLVPLVGGKRLLHEGCHRTMLE